MKLPVFWGTTFSFEYPLNESKYGFYPSKVYDLSVMALSGPVNIKTNFFMITSIGLSYSIKHTTEAKWNDIFVWPSKLDNPGVLVDAGIVFLPKSTLVDSNLQPGYYNVIWDAYLESSGIYIIQMT